MTIVEITNFTGISGFVNDAPFVFSSLPGKYQAADYWVSIFGAPDESRDVELIINGIIRDFFQTYLEVSDRQTCIDTEQTFYWDQVGQKLYIHFEHFIGPQDAVFQYGSFFGFSDQDMIYIDDQEYRPQLGSFPSLKQSEDLINYDQLAFINGNIKLDNTGGELDNFIDLNVYGNDVFLYYINDADIITDINGNKSSTRDKLNSLAAFYVEDYNISLTEITVKVQDKRKAQSATVAGDFYTETAYPNISDDIKGLSIPLAYGKIRELYANPINGALTSGDVDYKVWIEGVSFGTIQVLIDNVWTTKVPSLSDPASGTFTLLAADARDSSGAIRQTKMVNCEGISITYDSDVIKDLNERYLNIPYNSTFYNISEWESEEATLSEIGVVYDIERELFDAIREVQNGSNVGFRYEINADGLRTIRIDDESRASSFHVPNTDIFNIASLPVRTDSDNLYSNIRVKYAKSYVSGRFLSVTDDSEELNVLSTFRQQRRLTSETLIVDEITAAQRALDSSQRFSTIPPVAEVQLSGATIEDADKYLKARIFDIISVEVTPASFVDIDNNIIIGREYYGIKSGKIIGVDPRPSDKTNVVQVKLL